MKSEYSLDVAIPASDAVKRVMEMPGARLSGGSTFYSKLKPVLTRNQVCLIQTSESQIEFSESFGAFGRNEVLGDCIFDSISENKTQVTAKFQVGITSVRKWKIAIWIFPLLITLAAWFFYGVLTDSGTPESTALKITIIAGLSLLMIVSIYIGMTLWYLSRKINFFLKKFSNALGVGYNWI